ncbi:NAD kinase [Pediococcus argentinicus]|uniref:NAD kinase n=1 Tax=Pediococcus argentinicus TaxID=480391 RepID=UPI0033905818
MKIALYHSGQDHSLDVANDLKQLLLNENFEIDDVNPDIVITIGGDGTLLSAVHKYRALMNKVRFVGVHTGHLGFYTDWRDYELEKLVAALKEDHGEEVGYPLLEIAVQYEGEKKPVIYNAVNESTLKKISGTLVADVYIGGVLFERFRGDGLCVSTPTGSTAYNRSVGGAIVHPRLKVLQMAEIASINNRVFRTVGASLILAPNEKITIIPVAQGTVNFTSDREDTVGRVIKQVEYRIAKEEVHFAKYRHTGFWNRVQNAFIGKDNEV